MSNASDSDTPHPELGSPSQRLCLPQRPRRGSSSTRLPPAMTAAPTPSSRLRRLSTSLMPHRLRRLSDAGTRGTSSKPHSDTEDDGHGNDDDDGADMTAPPGGVGTVGSSGGASRGRANMHQSIFSLITAAGSRNGFHARFDDTDDGDEDDDDDDDDDNDDNDDDNDDNEDDGDDGDDQQQQTHDGAATPTMPTTPMTITPTQSTIAEKKPKLRMLPHIPSIGKKKFKSMAQSEVIPRASYLRRPAAREAPVLSRMIEARVRFAEEEEEAKDSRRKEGNRRSQQRNSEDSAGKRESPSTSSKFPADKPEKTPSPPPADLLAQRLMEMFGFDKPEPVLAEYECWLLRSVPLQGYLYVTTRHVCFYAYLPAQSHETIKSGFLSKRARSSLTNHARYWFRLKHDVLAYYDDPANHYFPSGHVDLRYGISADQRGGSGDSDGDLRDLVVTTASRSYTFRADAPTAARSWVDALRAVIFRSHHSDGRGGDAVKISLPTENVIDIEENQMLGFADFADAVQVRVIESADTFAIDEYFFSFFGCGHEATQLLQSLVNNNTAQQIPKQLLSPRLAGLARPEQEREDRGRQRERSKDHGGDSMLEGSLDSFVHSMGQSEDSSGSNILHGSDVFRSPTMNRFRLGGDNTDEQDDHGQTEESPIAATVSEHESETGEAGTRYPLSSPALQELVKAGTYPLQRAAGLAGYIKDRGRHMGTVLATEGRGYFEKMSGLLVGGSRHYDADESVIPEPGMDGDVAVNMDAAAAAAATAVVAGPADDGDGDSAGAVHHGDRFRDHFGLPPSERLVATYFGYFHRVLPVYGKMYVGTSTLCFRSLLLPGTTKTKLILPLCDVENVEQERGFRFGYQGLVVIIRGHEELFFEFSAAADRDDCGMTLLKRLDAVRQARVSDGNEDRGHGTAAEVAAENEHQLLEEARLGDDRRMQRKQRPDSAKQTTPESPQQPPDSPTAPSSQILLFDDPCASIIDLRPPRGLHVTCLTIGSRGDVQPYIALCKGLLAQGHKPRIATHSEFGPWVRAHGIDFAAIDGDPAELMRICVENGMFTYSFLREASTHFRGWIDRLLSSAWRACTTEGPGGGPPVAACDVLIESPSAMAGIHIAEALRVPYFRAFSMPWTRTRAYPHAFAVPGRRMGGAYNYLTYVMFDHVFWKAIAGQVNRWRRRELGLRATSLDRLQVNKVPFLYSFSPSVVPPPLDFSDWIRVTGYWFLDEGTNWKPPPDLAAFFDKARADGKPVVYIGFGSIVVSDPAALTATVVESVLKADVRAVLSKGWSDRLGSKDEREKDGNTGTTSEMPLPPEIFPLAAAPHDWLFARVDAAAHHGGAGTTGASLRAGIPTIVKPFFGDQFFFGSRVEDLGVGLCLRRLNVASFARALWETTRSARMIGRARSLGEAIRAEDGVGTAIEAVYRDLEYARTLVQQRADMEAVEAKQVWEEQEKLVREMEKEADRGTGEPRVEDDEWTLVENENGGSHGNGDRDGKGA